MFGDPKMFPKIVETYCNFFANRLGKLRTISFRTFNNFSIDRKND